MAKIFRDLPNQKLYLENNKNILSSDTIITYLKERAYVSLINPYKKLFCSGIDLSRNHIYPHQVNINRYVELSKLDDLISQKLFKMISVFEKELKSIIANQLCKEMYENGDELSISYIEALKVETCCPIDQGESVNVPKNGLNAIYYFHTRDRMRFMNEEYDFQKVCYRIELLSTIIKVGSNKQKAKNQIVKFYQNKQEIVPFWLLIHEMSFGELSEIYRMMTPKLRKSVFASFFHEEGAPRKYFKLERNLEFINKIRNTISHYESFLVMLDDNEEIYLGIVDALTSLQTIYSKSSYKVENVLTYPNIDELILESDYNKKYVNRIKNILKRL